MRVRAAVIAVSLLNRVSKTSVAAGQRSAAFGLEGGAELHAAPVALAMASCSRSAVSTRA